MPRLDENPTLTYLDIIYTLKWINKQWIMRRISGEDQPSPLIIIWVDCQLLFQACETK